MTDYTHEQIKEMLSKITQGEWRCTEAGGTASTTFYEIWADDRSILCSSEYDNNLDDLTFIASAPSIIRQLVGENEELKGEVFALKGITDEGVLKVEELEGEVERLIGKQSGMMDAINSKELKIIGQWQELQRLQEENAELKQDILISEECRKYERENMSQSDAEWTARKNADKRMTKCIQADLQGEGLSVHEMAEKIERLQSQLAKYERVMKDLWDLFRERGCLCDHDLDGYEKGKAFLEALKQLDGGKV